MHYIDRDILLRIFIDELPGCTVILLDAHGNVLSWNAGAQTTLGYMPHEIIGRHFSALHTKEDIASGKTAASLVAAVAHGRLQETGRRLTKDGTVIEVASVLMPLYDAQKELVGFGNMTGAAGGTTHAVAATSKLSSPPLTASKPKKILIVDDDDGVLQVVSNQLMGLGYDVIRASNGPEALEVLARVPDVDLLFTDIVMSGGLNGREVAEEARKICPGLKVLFTSGYFEGALVRNGTLESGVRLLVKPYRKKELAKEMVEVLGK